MINNEWIKDDDNLQEAMKMIEKLIPEGIKRTKEGTVAIKKSFFKAIFQADTKDKHLKKYIDNFPNFENKENGGRKELFFFDMLIDVVHLKDGVGFGELALINDTPRSATIRAVTDVHFATLEKEDFKNILGKEMRKRFANMLKYLNQFSIFKSMSRLALEKLALFFKKEEAFRGQKIVQEQNSSGTIFFIESGEFEVSK